MRDFYLLKADLRLFDGEGAAGGEAGNTGSQSGGQTDNTGDITKIKFGKQEQPADKGGSDAGSGTNKETKPEDAEAEFRALVGKGGKYAEAFTKQFQTAFNDRFKDAKGNEERLAKVQPLLDTLAAKYGMEDADPDKLFTAIDQDTTFWEDAAGKAGFDDADQYRQFAKLQRDNARMNEAMQQRDAAERMQQQVQTWAADAMELKNSGDYDFDPVTELKDPDVRKLLKAGIPFRSAYETVHMDEIKTMIAKRASSSTEKRVVDNVRAKGTRPRENGSASGAGVSFNPADPSTWTDAQFKEVLRRVKSGEEIKL